MNLEERVNRLEKAEKKRTVRETSEFLSELLDKCFEDPMYSEHFRPQLIKLYKLLQGERL